jgi:hypothetical protein
MEQDPNQGQSTKMKMLDYLKRGEIGLAVLQGALPIMKKQLVINGAIYCRPAHNLRLQFGFVGEGRIEFNFSSTVGSMGPIAFL